MSFTAFKSEGGLLPADLLDQIGTGSLVGQTPADFGLEKGRRLTDEIAAAWADARDQWRIYQRALGRLKESDAGTTTTRDQWMVPLLRLLGYDDLTYTPSAALVEGRTYAISHWAGRGGESAPVHIVGCRVDLDSRDAGRTRLSANALVQEYLNRTEQLWSVVTNGLRLRVLRDSAKLTRPAYLEIDLEQIMAGEKFAEFGLLYRLLHRTRLAREGVSADQCLLEQYYQEVLKVGGRVREKLRDGVEQALSFLGTGFLSHPANETLRQRWQSGALPDADLYRQLLRVIYRVLFLMVAEERKLVGPESPALWRVYEEYYSISRLRRLSERFVMGAERHSDLWRQLRATFALYRTEETGKAMEIAPLDGHLFGPDTVPDLENAELANEHLMQAIKKLSRYDDNNVPRRVNYGALDVEELGSVYEILLEYKPYVKQEGDRIEFKLVFGSERRATGSYYTHPDLVHDLIVHALDPVIEECIKRGKTPDEQVKELLLITVCDPACGSGHFLLAAARRIGGEIARIKAGEDQVKPEQYRQAVRNVIQHCIYGVDLNPLAVDLCKVALWLEGLNRGRPLNFLDHRIRCGNSLVGCTPEMLKKGIPDEAYNAVTGDDKKIASAYKKRNKEERKRLEAGHVQLAFAEMAAAQGGLASQFAYLDNLKEDSTEEVHRKANTFAAARREDTPWYKEWTACNLWTAAFFMPFVAEGAPVPTTETVTYFLAGLGVGERVVQAANRLADEKRFFHWHLEFPEVLERGGFDCVLGNPPFLGGLKISTHLGQNLLKWLQATVDKAGGTADLCAYFFRRAYEVLRVSGNLGLIATNTIAQGDTRRAGLEILAERDGAVTFAMASIKWPGDANLQVALVALHKGPWDAKRWLNGQSVSCITPLLDDGSVPGGAPEVLRSNAKLSFIGSFVLGKGFVLEPDEAMALIERHSRNADVLFPYATGEDVNSRPDQTPSRWVINFGEWPLERAETYPDCLAIIREKVKPQRDTDKRMSRRERWWRFGDYAPALYRTTAGHKRVLVTSLVTKHLCFSFVPSGLVYAHKLAVFALDDDMHFACMQSNVHEVWARKYSSTMRTDLNYSPSDCFETFPFPALGPGLAESVSALGASYHEHRRQVMLSRQLGMTKAYNLFHTPSCNDADIDELRVRHVDMDRAVLNAYGWSDVNLTHDFYGTGPDTRFTISPVAKMEILRRLLDLNLQRVAEEKG